MGEAAAVVALTASFVAIRATWSSRYLFAVALTLAGISGFLIWTTMNGGRP